MFLDYPFHILKKQPKLIISCCCIEMPCALYYFKLPFNIPCQFFRHAKRNVLVIIGVINKKPTAVFPYAAPVKLFVRKAFHAFPVFILNLPSKSGNKKCSISLALLKNIENKRNPEAVPNQNGIFINSILKF